MLGRLATYVLWLMLLLGALPVEASAALDKAEAATCGTIADNRHAPAPAVAVLSDATNAYRICTTRPQRVAPTNIVETQRAQGKTAPVDAARQKQQYSRFKNFACWPRRLSLPLRPFVSRFYYIIALRRILR